MHQEWAASMRALFVFHPRYRGTPPNLSNEQIAKELDVNLSDVHQMTTALREGIVKKSLR